MQKACVVSLMLGQMVWAAAAEKDGDLGAGLKDKGKVCARWISEGAGRVGFGAGGTFQLSQVWKLGR